MILDGRSEAQGRKNKVVNMWVSLHDLPIDTYVKHRLMKHVHTQILYL